MKTVVARDDWDMNQKVRARKRGTGQTVAVIRPRQNLKIIMGEMMLQHFQIGSVAYPRAMDSQRELRVRSSWRTYSKRKWKQTIYMATWNHGCNNILIVSWHRIRLYDNQRVPVMKKTPSKATSQTGPIMTRWFTVKSLPRNRFSGGSMDDMCSEVTHTHTETQREI